jgi:hypothetical protein
MAFVSTSAKTGKGTTYLIRLLTTMIYAFKHAYHIDDQPSMPPPNGSKRCVIQ